MGASQPILTLYIYKKSFHRQTCQLRLLAAVLFLLSIPSFLLTVAARASRAVVAAGVAPTGAAVPASAA